MAAMARGGAYAPVPTDTSASELSIHVPESEMRNALSATAAYASSPAHDTGQGMDSSGHSTGSNIRSNNSAGRDLAAMDGLRGICAVLVVVGHFITYWSPNSEHESYPLFGLDFLTPVTVFFVLSGFTLTWVYDKEGEDTGEEGEGQGPFQDVQERMTFYRRRIARMAPIYYLGLALALPQLVLYEDPFTQVTSGVIGLLWLQAVPCVIGAEWNGPMWTASALALLYVTFPSFLRLLRVQSTMSLLRLWAACGAFSICLVTLWLYTIGFELSFFLHAFVAFRLPHFLMGMCAALLYKRWPLTRPTFVAESLSLALLGSNVACMVMTAIGGGVGYWIMHMYMAEYVLAPLIAVWIMALAHPSCSGPTVWILSSRPATWLGDISYALYCLHWPVMNWCAWAVAGKGISAEAVPRYSFPGLKAWVFFPGWALLPVLSVCIAVSWLAHWALEKPARKALRK